MLQQALQLWCHDPIITTPILKLVAELAQNRSLLVPELCLYFIFTCHSCLIYQKSHLCPATSALLLQLLCAHILPLSPISAGWKNPLVIVQSDIVVSASFELLVVFVVIVAMWYVFCFHLIGMSSPRMLTGFFCMW